MATNPFKGKRLYDVSITGPGYEGNILSDLLIGEFEKIANDLSQDKKYNTAAMVKAILEKGRYAEEVKPLWVDFFELKEGKTTRKKASRVLDRFRVYSILVDEYTDHNKHAMDWRGLIAADIPETTFQDLLRYYALNYKSRTRGDIEAYLQGKGHEAYFLTGRLLFLKQRRNRAITQEKKA